MNDEETADIIWLIFGGLSVEWSVWISPDPVCQYSPVGEEDMQTLIKQCLTANMHFTAVDDHQIESMH